MSPDEVPGWFTPREADHLASLVQPDLAVVEIGSFLGRSACAIARRTNHEIVCVDPWRELPDYTGIHHDRTGDEWFAMFKENVRACGIEHLITPMRMTSSEAAARWQAGPIGVVFIDAVHQYEDVMEDFKLWSPHVVAGGWIALHDHSRSFPGVQAAARDILTLNVTWRVGRQVDSLWTVQRIK